MINLFGKSFMVWGSIWDYVLYGLVIIAIIVYVIKRRKIKKQLQQESSMNERFQDFLERKEKAIDQKKEV